ncbi:MAG: tripartite tricarboxylate transporter substrate binding protein [Xanthobacteraceae bacterium]|nr:tripartite tricarboxylate transporter substrate binding protein [Xanthobacteraceae bacterium]
MRLVRRQFLQAAAGAALSAPFAAAASAQAYPSRPVRMIVPVGAGGANDTATRLVAQKLSESLRQPFYVENIVGAGGNIGMAQAMKAAPDGYTMLSVAPSFVINPTLNPKTPFDPLKDFAPVTLMGATPTVVVAHESVGARTIKELIALLKANPGKLSYSSAGTGTPAHLAGELFKAAYGVDIIHVPFTGGGPAMNSTVGGHTPISFPALSTAAPSILGGKVRGLAVMSPKRSSTLPDVPTMVESGLGDQQADVFVGILMPAGAPRPVIDLIHEEIVKALALPDVKEKLATLGFDPIGNSPDAFGAWIKAEVAKWAKVMRDANIKLP